jgi:hypothetical protein
VKAIGKERDMKSSRWLVYTGIMLAVVITALVGPPPIAMLTDGHTRTVDAGTQTAVPGGASNGQAFDYFPSHYQLQAKEPAEPIATF